MVASGLQVLFQQHLCRTASPYSCGCGGRPLVHLFIALALLTLLLVSLLGLIAALLEDEDDNELH